MYLQIINYYEKRTKNTVLRQEIDHRIKNNLNIVSSILGLQIDAMQHNSIYRAEDVLKKSKLRIDALAMLHDATYKSKDFMNVDFKKYVRALANLISDAYATKLEVVISADDVDIASDAIMQIGIIINELLTNSLKYAFFHKENENKILITLQKNENECVFTYHEEGGKVFDINKIRDSKSLGFKLIALSLKQIKAHMNITQNGGLIFVIAFPLSAIGSQS